MRQPNIILTTSPQIWEVSIVYDDLYERVSQETSYIVKRGDGSLGEDHIILEDDKPLVRYYTSLAVSDLTSLLARRIDASVQVEGIENKGMVETVGLVGENGEPVKEGITYHLVMDDNLESNLQSSLQRYCFEYVATRVMEMWYKQPQGSDALKSSILKVLDFRRRPVRRPVRSFL